MRVFRGNCGQAVIFEGMLRATGNVIFEEYGEEKPIFTIEKEKPSAVFYRTLTVTVDAWYRQCTKCRHRGKDFFGNHVSRDRQDCPECKNKGSFVVKTEFIPRFYKATVRYDLTNNKGYIRMTREVIDFLTSIVPGADRILETLETVEDINN